MSLEIDRIYQGDCLELMKEIPDESIDMVFTDPPYGHNNNNGDMISQREIILGRGDYIPERDNRPIANDGVEAEEDQEPKEATGIGFWRERYRQITIS